MPDGNSSRIPCVNNDCDFMVGGAPAEGAGAVPWPPAVKATGQPREAQWELFDCHW